MKGGTGEQIDKRPGRRPFRPVAMNELNSPTNPLNKRMNANVVGQIEVLSKTKPKPKQKQKKKQKQKRPKLFL